MKDRKEESVDVNSKEEEGNSSLWLLGAVVIAGCVIGTRYFMKSSGSAAPLPI